MTQVDQSRRSSISGRCIAFGKLAFVIGFTALSTAAVAQEQNSVTLVFDDGDGITGELISFSNNTFRIDSSVGMLTIVADGVSCIGAACPAGTELETTSLEMTLTSLDGTIVMAGSLIEITDDTYVLATDAGEMRIATNLVTCEGDGCIATPAPTQTAIATGGPIVLYNDTTTIEGTFMGLENDAYLIDVDALGVIRVKSDNFECRGDGCP